MTYLCPKDYQPCCDDLCHGGGCIQMNSYQMLLVCDVCKGLIDEEIPECSTCSCEQDELDDFYDGPDRDQRPSAEWEG